MVPAKQLEGFGSYGFPESHAASFALIAYASSWMKCHHPDVFLAAILNAQPMGFYAPAQLVRDAEQHGVEVRPPDINDSRWDCTLEPADGGRFAVRLGLRTARGLANRDGASIVAARHETHSRLWRTCGAVRECRLPLWSAWPRRMRSARLASAGGKPYGRCGRSAANRSPCLPRQMSGVDRCGRKSRRSGSSSPP